MQAVSPPWAPPTGVLGRILVATEARLPAVRARRRELAHQAADAPPARPFAASLRQDTVAVIAEVKRRSPSKGAIKPGLSAPAQAEAYWRGGAAAISVLTEPDHFGGSLEDLREASRAVPIPTLRKDFVVDEVQILEARVAGASAVLLIARALSPFHLTEMCSAARDWGLEALLEVRDDYELDRARRAGAELIGVNNRDLETLDIDASTGLRLIPRIGANVVAVYESGIRTAADVEAAAEAGADAVLVGSTVSGAADPAAAVAALARVPSNREARRSGGGAH